MKIETFAEIEAEFIQKVHSIVWCNAATVDQKQRVRSRVLHPLWEGSTGWILTGRTSKKAEHLTFSPYMSLTYMQDPLKPVYVDCRTEWVDDPAEKQRLWDVFTHTPQPLGYDPAPFFGSVESPAYGLLKLTPWRIELGDLFGETRVWHRGA